MSFLGEIKRRKVFQVAAVYAVVAWLLVQIVATVEEPLRLPDWVDTLVILLLAIGFPITLIISWAFNFTPEGFVREQGSAVAAERGGRRIEYVLIGLLVIAVGWIAFRELGPGAESARPVLPNSVAVLPLENLTTDPANAFFAPGIHDTILHELAKIRDLNVKARTSMLRYEDTDLSIREIADELGVEAVMEGTVQYADGRVLVTVQLIDPETESQRWSERYDRELADIFVVQADIARQISAVLGAEMTPAELASIETPLTTSPAAHAYYLRARANFDVGLLRPGSSEDDEFQRNLDEAIRLDPDFALANAVKAVSLSFYPRYESLALYHADEALRVDATLGLAHLAKANVHLNNWRTDDTRDAFRRALDLSPNHPDILNNAARFHARVGDSEEALRLINQYAMLVDRVDGLQQTGFIHHILDDSDGAATVLSAASDIGFTQLGAYIALGRAEAVRGNFGSATEQLQIADALYQTELVPPRDHVHVIDAYTRMGMPEEAMRWFRRFETMMNARSPGDYEASVAAGALAYLAIGNRQMALEAINRLADERPADGWRIAQLIGSNGYGSPILDEEDFVQARRRLPGFRN